jgi:peptide deformylase
MIVPILKYGSPTLRKPAFEVVSEKEVFKLSTDLFDTLKKAGGIGLAAPQVGILKRAFVIDTTPLMENDGKIEKFEQLFLNPEIIWKSDETSYYTEGCLSIPDVYEDVLRPEIIRVRYQDVSFQLIEEELSGIIARIFQHEYDHLDGILFIDKINILKRKLCRSKLNRILNSNK